MWNKYSKLVFYTLGDIAYLEDDSWYPNSSDDMLFTDIMTTYSLVIEDSSASKLAILTQLMRMNYARFYDSYVFRKKISIYDNEDDITITSAERKEIWRRFINVFNITAPRYIPLLEQFEANKTNPIAQISSTSSGTTRFNDTPQDGGDYADDEHTTHITQTSATTTTDAGSIMDRLDALYKNWRSVLRDWTNEFKGLFYAFEMGDSEDEE